MALAQSMTAVAHNKKPAKSAANSAMQNQCACEQHIPGMGECAECRRKRLVTASAGLQRAALGPVLTNTAPPIVHEVLRSPGRPLDAATRAFMEPRFGHNFSKVPARSLGSVPAPAPLAVGAPQDEYEREAGLAAQRVMNSSATLGGARHDFSGVRIHTDAKAAESARAVNALAYTVGRDVVFGVGEYVPETVEGRKILAHELAHVAQQEGGKGQRIQRQVVENAPAAAPATSLPTTIKFWINAFIPNTVSGAITVPAGPLAGQTMFQGPFPWSDCYITDNRSFDSRSTASSRTHIEAEINRPTWTVSTPLMWSSGTREIDCEDGDIECSATATVSGSVVPVYTRVSNPFLLRLAVTSSASDPCVTGAPDVDVGGAVTINTLARTVEFDGLVDPFPAFEMYVSIDGGSPQTVFRYFDPGKGAFSLIGPPSTVVSGRVSF